MDDVTLDGQPAKRARTVTNNAVTDTHMLHADASTLREHKHVVVTDLFDGALLHNMLQLTQKNEADLLQRRNLAAFETEAGSGHFRIPFVSPNLGDSHPCKARARIL